jgi:predicted neutral ceramidase superfamily lipid hydrolase
MIESRRAPLAVALLTAVLALAAAAIAWSLGVALANDITDADYMIEPIEAWVGARSLILAVALVVGVASAVALVRLARSGVEVKPGAVAPVVGIGVAIGAGYSVVTAPVIGANIGGGMVMMALPVAVVFLAVAAVRAARRP